MFARYGLRIFLGMLTSFLILFGVYTSLYIYGYFSLRESAPATITDWSVAPKKENRYSVRAKFIFDYEGKPCDGNSEVGQIFPNPWAAENGIATFSQKAWQVWFDPNHPEKATLEKHFPFKVTISFLVILGLVIYFCYLGRFIFLNRPRMR
jgi:hypothetical protein